MTNKQREEAIRLYKEGATYDDIGGWLGIDPTRVGQIARKEGLPLRGTSRISNRIPSLRQKAHMERLKKVAERRSS